MFTPKTDRIAKLANIYPERIQELSNIFAGKINVYLDWSNMYHW